MKSWKPRLNLHQDMASELLDTVMTHAAMMEAALGEAPMADTTPPPGAKPPPLPSETLDWLTKLSLLYGVPFEYLIADARLLPVESMRFFYVDRNWLYRLIDGALSIGVSASIDDLFLEAFSESIYAQVDKQQSLLRTGLRNKPLPQQATVEATLSGLLFRSIVVSSWPGLEVRASKAGSPIDILRMDRLSADVLLVIFNDVPDLVEVNEPSEGLHFGVTDTGQAGTVEVTLRGLGFANLPGGKPISDGSGGYLRAQTQFRSSGTFGGVLDIETLKTNIEKKLPQGALGTAPALASDSFAIQMVQGAGLQAFPMKDAKKDCSSNTKP
jgi:hypothetical protein